MQRFGFALTKECSDADAKKKKKLAVIMQV